MPVRVGRALPAIFSEHCAAGRRRLGTKIPPEEDERLQKRWEKSDLWPKTAEGGTSTSGDSKRTWGFSNFCPEISYDRFQLFASGLYRYADEIDLGAAQESLGREGVPGTDWRWSWAAVSPMHFTECPLYSALSHSDRCPGGIGVGAVEETHAPTAREGNSPELMTIKPGIWGVSIDLKEAVRRLRRRLQLLP